MKKNNVFITNDYFVSPDFSLNGDSGLTVKCGKVIVTKKYITCHLGFGLELNPNELAFVLPRSSITKYSWMLGNSVGLIDENYRGEIQIRYRPISIRVRLLCMLLPTNLLNWLERKQMVNLSIYVADLERWIENQILKSFPYDVGDKCGQIVVMNNLTTKQNWCMTDSPSETDRGEGGFGSTGK
jgi:dUTPase